MRPLKETTVEFTELVKNELDGSTWTYESCNSNAEYSDCDKATNFLDLQRFSIKVVKEALLYEWDGIVEQLRELKERNGSDFNITDNANVAAKYIAHNLGYSRISRYVWDTARYRKGNSWFIDDSVVFKIV